MRQSDFSVNFIFSTLLRNDVIPVISFSISKVVG